MIEQPTASIADLERKPYQPPAVVHEIELEIRAGSPLNFPNPVDPFGFLGE